MYVSQCANHKNKGRYNGLFFGIFQMGNITSNYIVGAIIKKVNKQTFYIIMGCIGIAGSLMMVPVKEPLPYDNESQENEDKASTEDNIAASFEDKVKSDESVAEVF